MPSSKDLTSFDQYLTASFFQVEELLDRVSAHGLTSI
jgi:hypothetical protein